MTLMKVLVAAVLSIALESVVSAWPAEQPIIMIAGSTDGSALLRIVPGYGAAYRAQATVYRHDPDSKDYRSTKTFELRNPVAPAKAFISDGGEFVVTCDDWDGQIGSTPNVIVVYRGSGELVKAWSLEDIFSASEIKRFGPFPSNIPQRLWRGENVHLFRDGSGLALWIPAGRDLPWHVSLRLDLTSLMFEKYPERESDM